MGEIVSKVTDFIGITDSDAGQQAAQASTDASQVQAGYMQDALDYLKQQSALPTEIRDQSLRALQSFYYDPQGQSALINQVQSNPLYQQQLKAGEEAVLRSASATGGLRGGGSISDVANYSSNLLNQAVKNQLAGYQGLAGLNTNANQIASLTTGIGQALAQGQTAAAQAQMQAQQANASNLLGLGQLGIGALAFSDDKLKDNPVVIADTSHPDIKKYRWEWNNIAQELGMTGEDRGYLASEIEKVWPELVHLDGSGYRKIELSKIEKKLEELSNGNA